MYSQDSYSESGLKIWLLQLKICRTNLQNEHTGVRPPVDDIDAHILVMVVRRSLSSVRSIAEALRHSFLRIHIHVVQRLQLVNQYIRWVPSKQCLWCSSPNAGAAPESVSVKMPKSEAPELGDNEIWGAGM
jgi:hypothetical protein